jgi:hypothetical protein
VISGQKSAVSKTEKFMNRKISRLAIYALLIALSASADAQVPKKVPRIGYRVGGDVARESARFEAIRLVLREFGYIEGQNIAGRIPICGGQAQSIP